MQKWAKNMLVLAINPSFNYRSLERKNNPFSYLEVVEFSIALCSSFEI